MIGEWTTGRSFRVIGTVQGVGFRPWVIGVARGLGLRGTVQNDLYGVRIRAFGPPARLDRLEERLRDPGLPAARVDRVDVAVIAAADDVGFHIVDSGVTSDDTAGRAPPISMPPDLAVCEACTAELFDPGDRRFGHAFISCTACGPRFSIAKGQPFDRQRTTMAPWPLCDRCRAEYEDPNDRRFHAQTIACHDCGPRLVLRDGLLAIVDAEDPIGVVANALERGAIVAIEGIGGYHLACDARSETAVGELRRRKDRETKPLAVMARDLEQAADLVALDPTTTGLLQSSERPIVLVPRPTLRPSAGLDFLAPSVAPHVARIGVMLPYAPVHHLLLRRLAGPLVMTSANVSGHPACHRVADAHEQLVGIADFFLEHDREIAMRLDDSVVTTVGARVMVLRRGRGHTPMAKPIPFPSPRPVLATGAHASNAFAVVVDDQILLGPHIGDLDGVASEEAFATTIADFQRLLAVAPTCIAHDLHPDYASTAYADRRIRASINPGAEPLAAADMHAAADRKPWRSVGVQHHHAHVLAVMAEHGVHGPVLGLAFDGTGLGTDRTAWGGEFLLASYHRFDRLATFRPLALPGGDLAITEPWRAVAAAMLDAYGGHVPDAAWNRLRLAGDHLGGPSATPDVAGRHDAALAVVRQMLARDLNCPRAHGVGRYFDVAAVLVLGVRRARHEAELPMALEAISCTAGDALPFAIDREAKPWQVDLRPTLRALVDRAIEGEDPGALAAAFHDCIVAAAHGVVVDLLAALQPEHGSLPIVLAGGAFANARLTTGLLNVFGDHPVYLPNVIPPGDGGLAVGQAAFAAHLLRCTDGDGT